MNEEIATKTIEIIRDSLNKELNFSALDLKTENLSFSDKVYFNEILKQLNEGNILFNPKLGFEKITKGILINIGIHNLFHEFLEKKTEDELEDEFLKMIKIYEVKNFKKINSEDINSEDINLILEKIGYGFLNLIYLGSKINTERAKVDRALLGHFYYNSLINKTWWGYELDIERFYEELNKLETLPSRKIKNMIKEMGYFTLV